MTQQASGSTGVHTTRHRAAVLAALLLVYVVWGTTYFAIDVVIESMPPLFMNASRFALAGVIMMMLALARGQALPSLTEWRNAAVVGGLMVFVALNMVSFAQKLGIGSGLMATVVTTMPMWLALWTRLGGETVPLTSWAGLAIGVLGALLLALEGDFALTLGGSLLAFAGPLAWSIGSYASRRLTLPPPAMAAAAQWLMGGLLGWIAVFLFEPLPDFAAITTKAWLGWAYLVVMGTMVALNAYLWLLQNTSAALAGSYSFVNPAVALLVGVWLGGERLTGWVFVALPMIFAALALIHYGPRAVSLARGLVAVRDNPDTGAQR